MAVERACAQMVPRGPDDAGIEAFVVNRFALVLGSRRLAIIDPSPAGHQPMTDRDRGTTIVYNGMIYNFRDLRDELIAEGERFRSSCDTEVILKAYGRWGDECVRRLRGMFAFAIWDARDERLFLARDRLGIKPLYYWRGPEGRFLVASQVKALLETGLVARRLSVPGIETYLAFGAVSEPLTAIEDVLAFPAAHTGVVRNGCLELARYWDLPEVDDAGLDPDEAQRELRARLTDSISRHLVSDAPLGVFLSGGIDSSVLAAIAVEQTSHVRTVSVVFDDSTLSEEPYIDAMESRLQAEHVRVNLEPADLVDWSRDAFHAMDQPSFDGLNTYVVSRAASRSGLKVALSGLGGDELFNGYGYVRRIALLEAARRLPLPVRRAAAAAVGVRSTGGRTAKIQTWLTGGLEPGSSYELLRRLFADEEVRSLVMDHGQTPVPPPRPLDLGRELYGQIAGLEMTNYMKNVLLRDTDAMSMANSLEVRVPFLDDSLVEWVMRLPARLKAGKAKQLLVASVRDLIPPEIWNRRKQGFVLPLARWMGGELRAEIRETLAGPPPLLREHLNVGEAIEVWGAYERRQESWTRPWSLYALAQWTRGIEEISRAREAPKFL